MQRYVYPLIAPPTPEKLEQDKKSIEEQFERSFSLVEQLAKDTEELKAAEQDRQMKLDKALKELEHVIVQLGAGNQRRQQDAEGVKEEMRALRETIPKALDAQREATDKRMREVNSELASVKTLVTQRMGASSTAPSSNPLRPTSGNAAPAVKTEGGENAADEVNQGASDETPKSTARLNSFKALSNGGGSGKASIPAWQMAMAKQNEDSSTPGGSGENGASSSSS